MKFIFGLVIGLVLADPIQNADAKVLLAWLIFAISGGLTSVLMLAAWKLRSARLVRHSSNLAIRK